MNIIKFLFFSIILIVFSVSCGNKANKNEAEALEEVVLEEAKEMIASIPAPNSLVVLNLLSEAGAGYIYDITNKTEYIDNYLTVRQKALALGIYSADLSYVTIYNQQEESAVYINAFKQLIGDLEIPVVDVHVYERFERNIAIKDSLIKLVNEAFNKSNHYLNSNERVDIALYMLIGSWVETVYLLEKTIEFASNRDPLIKIVLRNKQTLDKIIYLLDEKKDDEGFSELYYSLSKIKDQFIEVGANPGDETKTDELKSMIKEIRANLI